MRLKNYAQLNLQQQDNLQGGQIKVCVVFVLQQTNNATKNIIELGNN